MLDPYLQDLEREMGARLSADDVHVRLKRAESHLLAEVDTLVAFGLDRTSAEREAVRGYGPAQEVALAAERGQLRPREALRTAALGVAQVLSLLWILEIVSLTPVALSAPVLALVALWARRPAPGKVLLSGAIAALAALILYPALYLSVPSGPLLRREAPDRLAHLERLAAGLNADKARFDRLEGDWDALRRPGGYLTPSFVGERLAWRIVPSRDSSDESWTAVAEHHDRLESAPVANQIAALREALDHPRRNAIACVVPILASGLSITIGLLVYDGLFGLLGAFAFALRRPRRRREAAFAEDDPRLRPTLKELERELTRGLAREEAAARIAEARAHLEESVEAREEMGLDPELAARDAVLAFGPVRRVAREMIRQGLAAVSAARLRVLGGLCAAYVLAVLCGTLPGADEPRHQVAFLLGLSGGLGALAVAAFRARRPALWSTLAATLGAACAIWMLGAMATLNVPTANGVVAVPRWEAADQIGGLRRQISNRRATRLAFGRAWSEFKRKGIDAYREGRNYRFPFVGTDGTLIYTATNRSWAIEGWNEAHQDLVEKTDTARLEQSLAAVRLPLDQPSVNVRARIPAVFVGNLPFILLLTLTDAAFAGLGALVFALRRRRHEVA